MPTAVITGANSGIGHAMAEILIKEGYDVYDADRDVGEKLQSLSPARLHRLDVSSPESISAFATQLNGKPVDVFLNVTGVMSPKQRDALETTNFNLFQKTFAVNTFRPMLLVQTFIPNLEASEGKPARIGIVSSWVGSTADNSTGGSYAHRSSKAAVNSIGKSLAVKLKDRGIVVSLLHPGIVRSNLNPDAESPEAVDPDESTSGLWRVFMRKDVEDTGKFWHRDGSELPW